MRFLRQPLLAKGSAGACLGRLLSARLGILGGDALGEPGYAPIWCPGTANPGGQEPSRCLDPPERAVTDQWNVVDASSWTLAGEEPQGLRPHVWLRHESRERTWLFKHSGEEPDRPLGEDFTEKLATST